MDCEVLKGVLHGNCVDRRGSEGVLWLVGDQVSGCGVPWSRSNSRAPCMSLTHFHVSNVL